jgi:F-type H+-transporting ATPase subunit epsilon
MFTLSLVTPQKKLLTDVEIDELIVPAHRGQLNILPGHAPLVSTLGSGVLKVKMKGEDKFRSAAISWGYMEVNPSGIVVLADTAEWPEMLDKKRVEAQLAIAQKRLQDAGLTLDEKIAAQRKLSKEQTRIDLLNLN